MRQALGIAAALALCLPTVARADDPHHAAARPGRLGMVVVALDRAKQVSFAGGKEGVLVQQVTTGSAAARAGVEVGDVIAGVAGTPVAAPRAYQAIVKTRKAGEPVALIVFRGDMPLALLARLDATPIPALSWIPDWKDIARHLRAGSGAK
ncbi:MAG TPA: PDZ domain-containing protein [Kofleriaceae bacterium]|nr:PDZ domain-containing protein [Kofleriaceae bacterium]